MTVIHSVCLSVCPFIYPYRPSIPSINMFFLLLAFEEFEVMEGSSNGCLNDSLGWFVSCLVGGCINSGTVCCGNPAENGKNVKPTATDLTWISNLMPDYNSANELTNEWTCGTRWNVCWSALCHLPPPSRTLSYGCYSTFDVALANACFVCLRLKLFKWFGYMLKNWPEYHHSAEEEGLFKEDQKIFLVKTTRIFLGQMV